MPIYEYACAACRHEFEEWQKMSDPPVRTCPKCKKKKVERLISRTAFQLKGGGWYADLYSSSKPGEKGTQEKQEKQEKSDGKSEASKSDGADAPASTASPKESTTSASSEGGKSAGKGAKKKESAAKKAEPRAA